MSEEVRPLVEARDAVIGVMRVLDPEHYQRRSKRDLSVSGLTTVEIGRVVRARLLRRKPRA